MLLQDIVCPLSSLAKSKGVAVRVVDGHVDFHIGEMQPDLNTDLQPANFWLFCLTMIMTFP